jgi:hypothetical protein
MLLILCSILTPLPPPPVTCYRSVQCTCRIWAIFSQDLLTFLPNRHFEAVKKYEFENACWARQKKLPFSHVKSIKLQRKSQNEKLLSVSDKYC